MWNPPLSDQLAQIPKLYSTPNIPFPDKMVYLHFFLGINEWFVTEFDGENIFAGYSTEKEQWGHFYFDELKRLNHQGAEVDCNSFWQVKPAKEITEITEITEIIWNKKG